MTKEKLIEGHKRGRGDCISVQIEKDVENPYRYLSAILFKEVIYPKRKTPREVTSELFFELSMKLLLPSSTDIYITGGKSHKSEIRLAKFLIKNLNAGDVIIDVGAHYGYFTLLGSVLVGNSGKVLSFEAAPKTFKILNENTRDRKNVSAHNLAVSDQNLEALKLYEFPNMFSEYNTSSVEQFESESWYSDYKPVEIEIESIILDDFLNKNNIHPKLFKIDVEGAEYKVISGMDNFLRDNSPILVMEYLSNDRGNEAHIKAEKNLLEFGYFTFIIDQNGEAISLDNISDYLNKNNLESDNIVFMKV